jgi:hypothetical protein
LLPRDLVSLLQNSKTKGTFTITVEWIGDNFIMH